MRYLVSGRYRSHGGGDDPSVMDGDTGFVGMDMRRQPGQLEAGLVVESRNGRMDGYWQPRKGAELVSGALTVDARPLRLPFFLTDDVGGYVGGRATATVNGTFTDINTDPVVFPLLIEYGLMDGVPAYKYGTIQGDGDSYHLFRSNSATLWTLQKFIDGVEVFANEAFDSSDTPDLVTGWGIYSGTGTPSSIVMGTDSIMASRDGEDVTLSAGYFPFPVGSGWLAVKDFETAGKTVDINGIYYVTAVSDTELTYSIVGADVGVESYTGPGTLISELNDDAVTDVLGSCVFSDPATSSDENIIIATNGVAKKVSLSDYTVTDVGYPSTETLTGRVDMIQAFDRVMIFRDGARAWHWIPGGRPVESASYVSGTGVVTVSCRDHGLKVGDVVTVSGIGFSATPTVADPNGSRTVATAADADTFTFVIATGAGDETYTAGTGKVTADFFTLAPAGVFIQPQTFSVAGDDYTSADGLVTITVSANTTIKSGDFVRILSTDVPELLGIVGNDYQVVTANATAISFYAPVSDHTGDAAEVLTLAGRGSIGAGFMYQPGAAWGTYFQRRLWVPYFYEPGGTYASPTYTDREIRDEIAASDILDADTYDRVESQFRITAGVADYLVGMHPFYDDALLVLMRNSLHIVVGTQGALSDTVVKELTREVGCLARKSIVSQGNAVFFLSDNGVYGIEFIEGYNLRGINEPLSKPIQPLVDRINRDLASRAVGVYFDNRYFLAVPMDTATGRGDAVGNNSVLVYNMLNRGWESIDTYGEGNFDIIGFHVAQAGERNDLYAVNSTGGVHLLDSRNDSVDRLSLDSVGSERVFPVDYGLLTRGYQLGTTDRKRFTVAHVQMQSDSSASDVDFAFITEDPDSGEVDCGSVGSLLGGDLAPNDSGSMRIRIGGVRGVTGQLSIDATVSGSAPVGRPKVQSVVIEGTVTNRATISQH